MRAVVISTAIAAVVVSCSVAFTMSADRRGEGAGTVSGVTISGVSYELAPRSSGLAAVRLQVRDSTQASLSVSFDSGDSYPCTTAGTDFYCQLDGIPVRSITELRVLANG